MRLNDFGHYQIAWSSCNIYKMIITMEKHLKMVNFGNSGTVAVVLGGEGCT